MSLDQSAPVREAALRILARRAYSAEEVADKLIERGFSEDEAVRTVTWLIELGYLDDRKLAADLVRDYAARLYGPYRIRRELSRRMIDDDLIAEALEDVPSSDALIDAWLRRQPSGRDRNHLRRKLSDALYRRGFGWDDIRDGLNRLEAEEDFHNLEDA